MKTRRLAYLTSMAIAAALALAALPASLAAQNGSFHRQFRVSGPVTLQLENGSGDVTITSMPGTNVTVDAIIHQNNSFFFGSNPKVIGEIEAQPPVAQQGNTIRITPLGHGWGEHVSITYRITTPAATAAEVHTGSGDIHLSGLQGNATATSGSGDMQIEDLHGSLRAHTGSGDIGFGTITGSADLSTGSGEIHGQRVTGHLGAHSGSGEVRVAEVGAGANVSTGSGSIELGAVSGSVQAQAASGDVQVDGKLAGDENWRVGTSSGDITITLPASELVQARLESMSGDIEVGLSHRDSHRDRHQWNGILGSANGTPTATLIAHSSSGSIRVH